MDLSNLGVALNDEITSFVLAGGVDIFQDGGLFGNLSTPFFNGVFAAFSNGAATGGGDPGTEVPEPMTAALLGLGVLGARLTRKKETNDKLSRESLV